MRNVIFYNGQVCCVVKFNFIGYLVSVYLLMPDVHVEFYFENRPVVFFAMNCRS